MAQQQRGDTAVSSLTVDAQHTWRGQHWLITGAAGSLGVALVQRLAAAGVTLVLIDKNKKALERLADALEADGREAPYLFPLDLAGASPEDYQRFVDALMQHVGHLDGLIHCAAHFDGLGSLLQLPALQWWVGLQANLSGPLLLSRELVPLLKAGAERSCSDSGPTVVQSSPKHSSLVFILDELERCAEAYWGVYGVAQWAWHGLTQQLAAELSNLPIRVQGLVAPAFQSGLRARAFPAEPPASLPSPEMIAEQVFRSLQNSLQSPVIMHLTA